MKKKTVDERFYILLCYIICTGCVLTLTRIILFQKSIIYTSNNGGSGSIFQLVNNNNTGTHMHSINAEGKDNQNKSKNKSFFFYYYLTI